MTAFHRTSTFDRWLRNLADPVGKGRILARIRAAEAGHFGDHVRVGSGVFEMRIHAGPGYRLYYAPSGAATWLLLCGGDKSTQPRDIRLARHLLAAQGSGP